MTISVFSVFGPNTFPFKAVCDISDYGAFQRNKGQNLSCRLLYYYTIIIFMVYSVNFEINI